MNETEPLVSAIITTHNRAGLLPRAIDSVISQSYSNIELIVVDDGSDDETPEVIEKYKERYSLIYIRNEQPAGAPAARNKGINAAKGKFIAGLDDDDEWREDRIEKLVEAYSEEYSCITSDAKMIYPKKEARWKKKKYIDLKTLLFTNQVGNQVLVSRKRLMHVGGFDENLKAAQDYDLWLRLCAEYGTVKNVQKPLQNIYMNHEQERITGRSFEGYLQFYEKHKSRMNHKQRKYQLYKIRRAQNKGTSFKDFFSSVPLFRWRKEFTHILMNKYWK